MTSPTSPVQDPTAVTGDTPAPEDSTGVSGDSRWYLPVLGADAPAGAVDPTGGKAAAGDASGSGCHGGRERLMEAAGSAGKSEVLGQLMADYPRGPHDQPQSMCPAFGSLRVGLRMRRTATVLSGSACCVYGLTFTSHFYGARRTVGYVPFNSETLVTGQLFEDIRKAMEDLADPDRYDAIVMTNLCIPTASGVPLDLLPREINGVRIIGIDVPGFGVPTHAEAKDVLSGALLKYAREEAERGAVPKPAGLIEDRPTVTLLGELFPVDPVIINALLAPMDMAVGTVVPTREWRELYAALDCSVVGAVHPFYTASVRQFGLAGRPVVGSGPVGVDGTSAWLEAVGNAAGIAPTKVAAARDAALGGIRAAMAANPIKGRISLSGYEGSELLVARVLIEAGAEVPYVGTACPPTEWSNPDREWLQARGTHIQYRASLEEDLAAFKDVNPDLVIGTTPVVQKAKESGTPGLYYTNLISARPIFGPAGAGSLAETISTAIGGRDRLNRMRSFFAGVGSGHTAGYGFTGVPERKKSARERNAAARGGKAVTGRDTDDGAGPESVVRDARNTDASTDARQRAAQSRQAKGSAQVSAGGTA